MSKKPSNHDDQGQLLAQAQLALAQAQRALAEALSAQLARSEKVQPPSDKGEPVASAFQFSGVITGADPDKLVLHAEGVDIPLQEVADDHELLRLVFDFSSDASVQNADSGRTLLAILDFLKSRSATLRTAEATCCKGKG
jgi:hypothetical protein